MLKLMTLPLTKKYEPTTSSEIPQETSIAQLKLFIQEYKKQKKKAALLHGASGTCKTSSVYAISKELGLEVIEVNSSDVRNGEEITEKLGNALKQHSLFYKGKVILMDELDGVSGTKDRGGIPALVKLLQDSKFPIVLTSNDPWDKKFSIIRSKSVMIQFQNLNYTSVKKVLKNICEKEKIEHIEDDLNVLAARCGGDLRAAINDLQSSLKNNKIIRENIESIEPRDKVESMISALTKIFKSKDVEITINAFNNVNEDFDKVTLWLDENLPKEYKDKEDLFNAYNMMSLADVYKGRIKKQQHWRFLIYINAFLSAGIAISKKEKNKEFVNYTPTTRILKIWRSNMQLAKKKSIISKLAKKMHCSTHKAMKELNFFKKACKNKKFSNNFVMQLELDDEELKWITS